jgi:hypothetical protein
MLDQMGSLTCTRVELTLSLLYFSVVFLDIRHVDNYLDFVSLALLLLNQKRERNKTKDKI